MQMSLAVRGARRFFEGLKLGAHLSRTKVNSSAVRRVMHQFGRENTTCKRSNSMAKRITHQVLRGYGSGGRAASARKADVGAIVLASFGDSIHTRVLRSLLGGRNVRSVLRKRCATRILTCVPKVRVGILIFRGSCTQTFRVLGTDFPRGMWTWLSPVPFGLSRPCLIVKDVRAWAGSMRRGIFVFAFANATDFIQWGQKL